MTDQPADSGEFFAAIGQGDRDEVRRLLVADPSLLGRTGPDGATAVLSALYHGHPSLADELAGQAGPLSVFEAAALDDTDRLATLVAADRSVVDNWSADGWQPLHLAAFFGRVEAARILLDADAPIDSVSANDLAVQPLHSAAAARQPELVWILIASDAPVNATQRGGWTPLHAAAANADQPSVEALLAAGADPTSANDDDQTPIDLATDDTIRSLLEA